MNTGFDIDGSGIAATAATTAADIVSQFTAALPGATDDAILAIWEEASQAQREATTHAAQDALASMRGAIMQEMIARGIDSQASKTAADDFIGGGFLHSLWVAFKTWLMGHNNGDYADQYAFGSLKESTMQIQSLSAVQWGQHLASPDINWAHTEATLLEEMAHSGVEAQRMLAGRLTELQQRRASAARQEREYDFSGAVVREAMAPRVTAAYHSSATDWMGEDPTANSAEVQRSMAAEASRWYLGVSPEVRADDGEFRAQASSMASAYSGRHAPLQAMAADTFVRHALFLNRSASPTGAPARLASNPMVTPLVQRVASGSCERCGGTGSVPISLHEPEDPYSQPSDFGSADCPDCGGSGSADGGFDATQRAEMAMGASRTAADSDINPYPANEQAGYAESGLPVTVPVEGYEEKGVVGDYGQEIAPENAAAVAQEGERTPMPGAGDPVPGVTSAVEAGMRPVSLEALHSIFTSASGSFQEWMSKVDAAVEGKVGLSVHDLEDQPFMDWFEDGVSPTSAANRAIRYSKGGSLQVRASGPVKGIAIYPDKRVEEVTLNGLESYQSIVKGYIEPITLKDGSTLYVNEEYLYQFSNDDVNWVASDVCGLGGRPEFMLQQPILGPAVLVGPLDAEGNDTDVTGGARQWVTRVAREAKLGRRLTSSWVTGCDTCSAAKNHGADESAYRTCDHHKGEAKESRRVLAEDGQTCATCGDTITRDPEGEPNRSYHHTNGTSHDHEAKPKEGTEASRRTAYTGPSAYSWDERCHCSQCEEDGIARQPGTHIPLSQIKGGTEASIKTADGDPCPARKDSDGGDHLYGSHDGKCRLCGAAFPKESGRRTALNYQGEEFGTGITSGPSSCLVCGNSFEESIEAWVGKSGMICRWCAKDIQSGASRRTAGISLTNVGIVDREGLICKGTDPSGSEVRFKVTQSEMADLVSIMLSDLAMNFSGVTISESDIVASAGRRTSADRDRATSPQLGDQTACSVCGSDIEYHDGDWLDRGSNTYCDESGQHPILDGGDGGYGSYPHVKHAPVSDRVASRRTAGIYCKTHQVWVGDGNASTHTDCAKEQKATEKTKGASRVTDYGVYEDCEMCDGRGEVGQGDNARSCRSCNGSGSKEGSRRQAGTDPSDQDGSAESSLPTPEKDATVAWPWELPEGDVATGQDAASVATVPTPGQSVADYPQP